MIKNKSQSRVSTHLRGLSACSEAIVWSEAYDDLPTAWDACERGDWLLWYAARAEVDRRLIVRAACACARTALRYVPEGETRPLRAIEAAEAWTRGEVTIDEVRSAAYAARAAAATTTTSYAYTAAYAAYAAYAADAVFAADAVSAATRAADAAAFAADAVAYASAAASAAAARAASLREMAVLVRETLPRPEVLL
jgi:hypothetical protein